MKDDADERRSVVVRVGPYSLSGQSALATELVSVADRARKTLMVTNPLIVLVDVIVTMARLFTNDEDPRALQQRLVDLEALLPDLNESEIRDLMDKALVELNKIADPEHQINKLFKRARSTSFQKVVRRMVGAAQYDRLERALHSDVAVVVVALRRLLRLALPLAIAIDDCTAVLQPEQINRIDGMSALEGSYLTMTVQLDAVFDKIFEGKLPLHLIPKRPGEERALQITDLEQIADDLHKLIVGRTRDDLMVIDEALARKVKGARDALETSADAASQAANSLIEFIDRLLRNTFSEEFVIGWAKAQMPEAKELVFVEGVSKKERPTKRCQALCFLYAGNAVTDETRNGMHALMALGLYETRQRLQGIKHDDQGTPEELAELQDLMAGVEGFITYAVQLSWRSLDDSSLNRLRSQMEQTEAKREVA